MEWISVEDRLPEKIKSTELKRYLVCRMGDNYSGIDVELWSTDYWANGDWGANPVTHWMELPEPPDADEREETRMRIAYPNGYPPPKLPTAKSMIFDITSSAAKACGANVDD